MLGHVNNTVFFRYCEQARSNGRTGSIARARLTPKHRPGDSQRELHFFCSRLVYPGEVEVRMYLGEPGRTSPRYVLRDPERRHEARRRRTPSSCGSILASGRSVPLPDVVIAPLRAHESPDAAATHADEQTRGGGERNATMTTQRHVVEAVTRARVRGRTSPNSQSGMRRPSARRRPTTRRCGAGRATRAKAFWRAVWDYTGFVGLSAASARS
jgi:acyl-CoA thioester hydrolase